MSRETLRSWIPQARKLNCASITVPIDTLEALLEALEREHDDAKEAACAKLVEEVEALTTEKLVLQAKVRQFETLQIWTDHERLQVQAAELHANVRNLRSALIREQALAHFNKSWAETWKANAEAYNEIITKAGAMLAGGAPKS